MKNCPYCAHANREGVLFCEECGQPFMERSDATTRLTDDDQAAAEQHIASGTSYFKPQSSIVIRVRDAEGTIKVVPQNEIVLGRADGHTNWVPDLDMTPYRAAELGVSRRHASIQRGDGTLMLADLGSVNGTHLNGQLLVPNQPRVLRDGDEIRMGKLVFHIFFT